MNADITRVDGDQFVSSLTYKDKYLAVSTQYKHPAFLWK